MDNFLIATFNVKDKGPIGNIITDGINRPAVLAEYLLREKIDVIGMQETTKGYLANLSTNLPENYKLVGDARQLINPFFNESNTIATPHGILVTETIQLPHRPKGLLLSNPIRSLTDVHKRVATWAIVNIPNVGNIFVINLHLTYLRENLSNDPKLEHFNDKMIEIIKAQFDEVLELQKTLKALHPEYPIIVMGDYNSPIYNRLFEDYMIKSEKAGMHYVPNIEKTQKNNEAPIDHMLYSDDLELLNYSVGDTELKKISDHEVLKAEFRRR